MIDNPVIVSGMGGSGTRLVASLVQAAGFQLGETNYALDALAFVEFSNRWIPRYYTGETIVTTRSIVESYQDALDKHLAEIDTSRPWGIKHNRALLMAGFWAARHQKAKFIHVVRNGLDMACSDNMNQVKLHGDLLLPHAPPGLTDHQKQIDYWNVLNRSTRNFFQDFAPDRYLAVRYEDVCLARDTELARIADFIGATMPPSAKRLIGVYPTIGRWKRIFSENEVEDLLGRANSAMVEFGYSIPE